MMNRMMLLAVAAGALMFAVGCSSLQTAPKEKLDGVAFTEKGDTIAHINASVGGWYFLCFPILTGSSTEPGSIAVGKDTCNVTTAAEMVTAQAKRLGAKRAVSMVSTQSSAAFFPIPLLFRWRTTSVSAVAVR